MAAQNVLAQQYTFIPYNLKEGLPQSQVRCLMQDSRGFIWIGTLGGLSKFDGRTFFNYSRKDGLLNNQINTIVEMADGSIVAGSNGSLSIIRGRALQIVELQNEFRESTINTLYADGTTLWIGLENGLLCYETTSKSWIDIVDIPEYVREAHIKTIHRRINGELLILTKEKLFAGLQNSFHEIYSAQNDETSFFDLAESSDGTLWLASKNEGLIHIDAQDHYLGNYSANAELPTNLITGVMVDKQGLVWMTSRYGFFSFDGTKFNAYTERNGLDVADVRDIIQDREGNIWVGTYGQGLLRFTGRTFTSYTNKDGLTSNAVMSIVNDQSGNYWFSTFDKGVCTLTGDSIAGFTLKDLTDNNRIWTSLLDHQGNIWFGSSDGLFRYHDQRFELFTEDDSLTHPMVLSLFEDANQVIWIGTNKGITQYADGVFKKITLDGAPSKKVRCIKQDKGGHIWIAAIDGVYRFDGAHFKHYSQKDGLPENSTNCIEIDDQNRVWVGTQNGVAVLEGVQFFNQQVGESSGSNVVNFLRIAKDRMWIGTNDGLFSVPVSSARPNVAMTFKSYGLFDGLRSLETNLNSVFWDEKQYLWFGTTDGVTRLDLNAETQHEQLPSPLLNLTDLKVNLQDVDWSKMLVYFQGVDVLPWTPEFTYRQNHITFYFTGISTTYPEEVSYQYMLEGLDDDWKATTTADFATYSNLPYRDFVFHVRARNGNGEWSSIVSYAFSVAPPFWLTWWFITLEVLLAAGIIVIVLLSRRRARIAKQEKEWFEIRSRMLALEQQSLNSSMNRHFIFNALNSIQYYINRQDRIAANRYLSDFARLIRKNLDSSQDNLTTLRDEIERLELYLKLEHMRFKDKFTYKINIDPQIQQDQIKVPAMLVQPFLENSIWHGLLPKEEGGEVIVDIRQVGEYLEFMVTDNGIGIENSLKNKTTADSHISKGMEITQNRIELIRKSTGKDIELRGPYQIQEKAGQAGGTRVEIKIPVNFGELF